MRACSSARRSGRVTCASRQSTEATQIGTNSGCSAREPRRAGERKWLDDRKDVLWWSSEEKALWYWDPVQKKNRRYFPDFIIHYKNKDDIEKTEMIEVKPQSQVEGPPQNPKRRTKAWVNAVYTYINNQAKWDAAKVICEDRGWDFRILSEATVKKWRRR